MKTVSTALAAHLAQPVTTLATCWRITRTDGITAIRNAPSPAATSSLAIAEHVVTQMWG